MHPEEAQGFFYRTSAGAEVDLLLEWPGGERWAIEVKRSLAPKLERGFHLACADIVPARRIVVHPGRERFRLAGGIEAMPLEALLAELSPRPAAPRKARR